MDQQSLRALRLPEVERRTGLTRPTIYRRAKEGTFPKPVRLGGNSSAWIESEIDGWLAARIAERDSARDASPHEC